MSEQDDVVKGEYGSIWKMGYLNSNDVPNKVTNARMRDQVHQIKGLLRALAILIENEDYKLYRPNPVETLLIELEEKMERLNENLGG